MLVYYKLFVTRTLVLSFLLLITLSLIALTEYACRSIPAHPGLGGLSDVAQNLSVHIRMDLGARQTCEWSF
jgi:hypothetical protein